MSWQRGPGPTGPERTKGDRVPRAGSPFGGDVVGGQAAIRSSSGNWCSASGATVVPSRSMRDSARSSQRGSHQLAFPSTGRDTEARDHIDAARAVRAALPRRDRHTVDIVTAAAERSAARATGLAAEHLREYPDDQLVRFVAAGLAAGPGAGRSGASGAEAP